jgi:hypothetical protein
MLNWGRATLGTIPLVMLGGYWAGARGVFTANLIGAVFFGIAGVYLARRCIQQLRSDLR